MKFVILAVALLAVCAVAQDTCAYSDAQSCDAASSCTWCKSGAVKSKCYSIENSKKLPGGVFVCDKNNETLAHPLAAAGPLCSICTDVVKSIELPLEQEGCDVFLPKYAEKVCSYLGPFGGACVSWLEGECPKIFDLLEKGVASPQAICQDIKACSASSAFVPAKVPDAKQPINRPSGAAKKLSSVNKVQGFCDICENLVPDFFVGVENVGCDIGAKYAADIACAKWAPHLPGCSDLVVKGCDALVDAVKRGVSPDTICKFLHVCPAATVAPLAQALRAVQVAEAPKQLQAASQSKGYCQVCESIVPSVFAGVVNVGCDVGAKAAAQLACAKFAPHLPGCADLAAKACESIVEAVQRGVSADTICHFVHAC